MNSPVMQGLNLNTPSHVRNARLIAWVIQPTVSSVMAEARMS